MGTFNTNFRTIRLNATGDSYYFGGALNAGGVVAGGGLYVGREGRPASWDKAGWMQLIITSANTNQLMIVDQREVLFQFYNAFVVDRQFDQSIFLIRFQPVPWLGVYNLYGFDIERNP